MKDKTLLEFVGINGKKTRNEKTQTIIDTQGEIQSIPTEKNYLKLILITIYVAVAAFVSWSYNQQSLIGIDDANIYFVYMQNFAEGHGFVYNPGGERVEGFTSLLWTIVGAGFFFVFENPMTVLFVTNILLIAVALWQIVEYIDNYFEDSRVITPISFFFLGALFIIPGYFEWTVLSLMETGLWSALLTFTAINVLKFDPLQVNRKNNIAFCTLLLLLVICRPESILWCGLFIMLRAIKAFLVGGVKQSAVAIIPAVLTFVGSFFALVSWRINYFGFPFPNTYYAKVSDEFIFNIKSGIYYDLLSGFYNNPLVVLALLLLPFVILIRWKWNNLLAIFAPVLLFAVALLTVVIPMYTGGDHFAYARFFQPTTPLILAGLCLSLRYFTSHLKQAGIRNTYLIVLLILIFTSFFPKEPIYQNVLTKETPLSIEWQFPIWDKATMEVMNDFFKDNNHYPSQGVLRAGANAFYYAGITNDLLGLNNVEMAHRDKVKNKNTLKNHGSFNLDVFFEQQPDVFWTSGQFVNQEEISNHKIFKVPEFEAKVFRNVHLDPRFLDQYQAVIISHKNLKHALKIFASTEFLEAMDTSIYQYQKITIQ